MQVHSTTVLASVPMSAPAGPVSVVKISTPVVYVTDHPISQFVCRAFAAGCNGRLAPTTELLDGEAVVYGILRGCEDIIRRCEWTNRRFWHIDLGYFRRSQHAANSFSGYYRVSDSAFQHQFDGLVAGPKTDRWKNLGITLKPWRKTGRNVVIVPPTMAWGRFAGIFPPEWVKTVTAEMQRYTDRPILVANKETGRLNDLIGDCWALVTLNSNAAVEALVSGIPIFVLGNSAVEDLGHDDLSKIETPYYPEDRELYFAALADCQYTLDEFRDGTAWKLMRKMHG